MLVENHSSKINSTLNRYQDLIMEKTFKKQQYNERVLGVRQQLEEREID